MLSETFLNGCRIIGVTLGDVAFVFRKCDALAANLHTTAHIRRAFVGIYLHPLYLAVLFWPILLRTTGMFKQEVPSLTQAQDNLYYVIRISLFLVAVFTYCPAFLRWTTARNIPVFAATFVFFGFHSFLSALFGHFVFAHPTTLTDTLLLFARHMVYALLVHTLALLYYESRFRAAIGLDTKLVPFMRPLAKARLQDVSAAFLDPDLSGPILFLQAQNQYVRVGLSEKTPLVRMTFSEAMAKLPPSAGIKVHRSWWVSVAASTGMQLDRRAEELVMEDGTRVPVSKTKIDEVASWLRQLDAA